MSKKGVAQVVPLLGYFRNARVETPKSGLFQHPFRGVAAMTRHTQFENLALQVDDSALQSYRHSVCSVIGAEFGEDVADVTFHGLFRDGELGGNLLVGVAA